MRDTMIMLAAVAAIMLIIGYTNAADIENCMEKGNSFEVCDYNFNR